MNKKDLDNVNLLKSDIAVLYSKVTRETNSLTTDAYNTFSKVSTDMTTVTNKVAVLGDMLTDLRVLNGTAKTIQYLSDLDIVENNGIKVSDDKFELATLNTVNREINSTQSSISSLENYSLKTISGKPAYLEDFIKTGSELVVDFPTSNYTFTLNLRYDSPEQINSIDLQLALTTQSYPLILSIKYVDTSNNISEAIILDNNSKNINLDEYRVRDNLYTLNITPIVTDQLIIEFSSRDKSSVALKGIKTAYRTPINEGSIILGPIHSEHPILKLALNSDRVTEGVLFEVSSDLDYWLPITNSSNIATTGGKKILSFNTVNTNSIKTDEDVYSLYLKISLTSKEITNEDVPIEIYKTYREDNAISNDTLSIVEDNLFSAYRVQNSDFSYGNYLYVNALNTSRISLDKLEYIENDGVLKVLGLVSSKYSVTNATNEGISIGSIGAELKLHRLEANKVIDARGFDLANSIIYDVYPREISGTVNTKQKDNFCLMLKKKKETTEAPPEENNDPKLQTYQTEIDRFDPTYWRVDGPQTASFAITDYNNGFEVSFQCRQTDDLVGIIWNSQDTKDHQYLSYGTDNNYSGLTWSFDLELSPSMPVLNDPQYAPTLTVNYKDNSGRNGIAYIALWNYALNPTGRSSKIIIDWDTVKGGYAANTSFNVTSIQSIFFGGYVTGYDKTNVAKFDTTKEGYLRLTNSSVSGRKAKIKLTRVVAIPHNIGMCTSYDDHYDLNPKRIVNNLKALGYSGFLNHYCGMSHYPVIDWNESLARFQIPDTLVDGRDVVNTACKKWHQAYANALKQNGFEPVFSVSWELYSLGAREEWCQREWDDTLGRTGYTPPSYFASLCHANAIAYLHKAYREFADILVAANLQVNMQIGEPWWWFNVASLNPCVYDYQTRLAFNADTGLFAPDLGNIYEAVNKTDPTSMAFKTWLRNKLGQTCQDIRTMLKTAYGSSAQVCPLIFFPSIRTHQESLATYINYPQEHYAYPNFDYVMTEAYDWVIEQPPRLDLSHQAVNEIPIGELGYPPEKVAYLSGFVPDKQIAYIYKFDWETNYRSPIWQRIFGDIKNNEPAGIMKQLAWAYPQVMFDSITISDNGFFVDKNYTLPIQDNTPYPENIIGDDLQPPVEPPVLQPVNIAAKVSSWGDLQITFDVNYDIGGTSYDVHLLNETGVYSLVHRTTTDHYIFVSIAERNQIIGTDKPLKVLVVPSTGRSSEIVDIEPTPSDSFVEKVIVFAGQSNAENHFLAYSGTNARKDLVSATDTRNAVATSLGLHQAQVMPVKAAWGSSAADKLAGDDPTSGVNYWYDLDSDVAGPRLTEALSIIAPISSKVHAVIWGQGENDADANGMSSPHLSNVTRYTDATNKILNALTVVLPSNTKIYWQVLGRKYSGTPPSEIFGLERYDYRQAQIAIITARADSVMGSWCTGIERLSGYVNESNIYGHYTSAIYHTIANELGQAIANNLDRIGTIPSWVSMSPIANIEGERVVEDIKITWDASPVGKYKLTQINVVDGTIIYSRTLTTNEDIFTAQEQRDTYTFLASTVICKVSPYDDVSDIESPVVTKTLSIP